MTLNFFIININLVDTKNLFVTFMMCMFNESKN